jgi:hypothetical protein
MIRVPLHLSTGIDCHNRQVADEWTRRYSPDLPRMASGQGCKRRASVTSHASIHNEVFVPITPTQFVPRQLVNPWGGPQNFSAVVIQFCSTSQDCRYATDDARHTHLHSSLAGVPSLKRDFSNKISRMNLAPVLIQETYPWNCFEYLHVKRQPGMTISWAVFT